MPLAVEWGSTETFLHSHVVHGFRVLASVWRKVPEIQFIDKFIEVPVQTLCCSNAHDIQMVGVWFKYVHIGRQTASDNNCLYAVYFIQFFILIFWMYFFFSLSLSLYTSLSVDALRESQLVEEVRQLTRRRPQKDFLARWYRHFRYVNHYCVVSSGPPILYKGFQLIKFETTWFQAISLLKEWFASSNTSNHGFKAEGDSPKWPKFKISAHTTVLDDCCPAKEASDGPTGWDCSRASGAWKRPKKTYCCPA